LNEIRVEYKSAAFGVGHGGCSSWLGLPGEDCGDEIGEAIFIELFVYVRHEAAPEGVP
jgi:hypothetical protein